MNQKLVIIRGVPGSGKSTRAAEFVKLGYAHFENDQFLMRNGVYDWTPERLAAAISACFNAVKNALQDGQSVVVSNCFITHKSYSAFIKLAESMHVQVEVINCFGEYQNQHNVPDVILQKMRRSFQP